MKNLILRDGSEFYDDCTYLQLWRFVRAQSLSRRRWPDALAATIYGYPGKVLSSTGYVWIPPEIDDVMGDPRWISYYQEASGRLPKRRCVRSAIERLKLLDLYRQILVCTQ